MKKILTGLTLGITLMLVLAATNLPQSWTWDKTSQWFSVLMKDGGGTKFVAAAPKQYFATFGGGLANCSPTGTPLKICGSPSDVTAIRSQSAFVPYKTVDGGWRLRFNLDVSQSYTSTGCSLEINGVTFKGNSSCAYAHDTSGLTGSPGAYTNDGNNIVSCYHPSKAVTLQIISCDVAIAGNPAWADAN